MAAPGSAVGAQLNASIRSDIQSMQRMVSGGRTIVALNNIAFDLETLDILVSTQAHAPGHASGHALGDDSGYTCLACISLQQAKREPE